MAIHGRKVQFSRQITAPAISLLHKHALGNKRGRGGRARAQNKFGFPIYTDPLAHQHLNENMNVQSKRIYRRQSSRSAGVKMATVAGDKRWKSNGKGKGRKLAKNRAFHEIISSFQAVSPHLIWHTFPRQCISLLLSSTFNENTIPGTRLILLVKYLACACRTPPFVPLLLCSCAGAVGDSCRR